MKQKLARLGDVAEIQRDSVSPSAIREGTPYVGLEHIDGSGRIEEVRVAEGELASSKFRFSSQHVLYGKLRPYLRKIARPSFSGICSTDVIPIRPGPRIDREYLFHVLRQDTLVAKAASLATGINLPRISPKMLETFEIPLPPLDEQRRIAAILDQADDLRRKRRQTLERLDDLRDEIFVDMFVQSERHDWPIGRVADIATDVRTGPFGSQLLHSEFVEEGIAVLGIDNAVHNEFRWDERRFITAAKYLALRRYTVRPGDVLITMMGTCGRCAVVPENIPTAINTKHLCCITLNTRKALPAFLHASFLQHPSVLRQLGVQTKGAVMPGLNMEIIKSLELHIPPLDLQHAFVARIEALDQVRASCREHKNHLDALFASLQYLAFRGELSSKAMRELAMVG